MPLFEFSVNRPMLGHMLTLLVVILGSMAAWNLRRDTFPDVSLDIVLVRTIFPNASPEEVEELITRPVEDELRELDDIKEYTSQSVEGLSMVTVVIDPDAPDKQRVINHIQRRIDRVRLPDGAEEPVLREIRNDDPVIRVCVSKLNEDFDVRAYVNRLEDKLELIDGVSKVEKYGWREEEYWVEVDPEKLDENQLSIAEVIRVLRKRNINLPGGKIPMGEQELILRTIGKFHSLEEIREIVIRSNFSGKAVTVGDVATVRRTFEPDAAYAMTEGRRVFVLSVKKSARADVIKISDTVHELVEAERSAVEADLNFLLVDDQAYYVKRRLHVVKNNGAVGIVLVVLCLLAFINVRVALFTAFGIPFSFLIAFLLMAYFGSTINLMTMFGLIIVLGMVVDDAIIVGENIFRHMEEGMSARDAAIQGTREVALPVLATVLTTIAAFLPLIYAPDVYGKFLRWLTFVVIFALVGSLLECLFLLPVHISEFSRNYDSAAQQLKRKRLGPRFMELNVRFYRKAMRICLKLRYLTLLALLGVFAGMGVFAVKTIAIDIFPKDLIDVLSVPIAAPAGSSLAYTEKQIRQVEELVRGLPDTELQSVVSYIGSQVALNGIASSQGTRYGQLLVYLTPQEKRVRKTIDIKEELNAKLRELEDLEIKVDMISPGPPVGRPLEVKIVGDDFEILKQISGEIQAFLSEREGVYDIDDDLDEGKRELHLKVDELASKRLGLDLETVAQTVFAAFEGAEATVVREGKEELKVRVRLREPHRSELEQVKQLKIPNQTGRLIALGSVARFDEALGFPGIAHHDGRRAVTVSATINTDLTTSQKENGAVFAAFKDLGSQHPDCRLLSGGEWKENRKIFVFMVQAFAAAILLIYVILCLQFNSFLQPFVLLASIPLGFIGVSVALVLHDKPLSMMALMGMVGLAGVVVNDAILLVSFINDRRKKGVGVFEATLEAGCVRLRPILLTSVTTIAGMMPVIFGIGGYEPFIVPAAITLAYGLLCATVLTLAVVPCLYLVLEDLMKLFRWRKS
ncbi:MAG: multidrug efflux pump subunit AcrB [Candidatus Omnitrophota bacterium]|jgi:multidrug efflux pump subunit AcrB